MRSFIKGSLIAVSAIFIAVAVAPAAVDTFFQATQSLGTGGNYGYGELFKDSLKMTSGADTIKMNNGDDIIYMGADNDQITTGPGNDVFCFNGDTTSEEKLIFGGDPTTPTMYMKYTNSTSNLDVINPSGDVIITLGN